ncbi:MAG: phosphatidylethanolamine-binding protein [Rhodospirillales bacterium]|nr:phosphatidylethanolamine-binding protein [Rhodospirillales bacterium]
MLQHLPTRLGRLLHGVRQDLDELMINDPRLTAPATLVVTSVAFPDGSPIPFRFTEDGDRVSPPIGWSGVPDDTGAILVIIEDADSPTPKPLVHAIVIDQRDGSTGLAEGEISDPVQMWSRFELGRNSFFRRAYLPPDPPPGHGPHRYAFQVFALSDAPEPNSIDGRSAALDAMIGNLLAKGCLVGTYERA